MPIKIKVFKAIDEPALTRQIFLKHKHRLAEYNVEVTSVSSEYENDPDTILICAINTLNNEILGSVRIQFHNNVNPLPLVTGLKELDSTITNYIESIAKDCTIAESCGVWCVKAEDVKNLNLSLRLYTLSIALCRYLQIEHCLALVPKHTLRNCLQAGFQFCTSYPEPFHYPSKRFDSYVLRAYPLNHQELKMSTREYSDSFNHKPNFTESLKTNNKTYLIQHEIADSVKNLSLSRSNMSCCNAIQTRHELTQRGTS